MSDVQVAHTRMVTHDNGVTGVYVQVAQPVSNLSAALFAHDSIEVAWRVGLTFKPSDNPLVWLAGAKLDPSLPSLLEVGNFVESTDTFLGSLTPGPVRFVHVRPAGGTGIWVEGPDAQAELARVEAARAQGFMQPMVAPGSAQGASEFVIFAVADGLLITQPQRVPGISLTPFKAALGDDVMSVLNRIIQGREIPTILDPQAWRKRMQSNRPAVLIECRVRAENEEIATSFSREKIKRLLDMMTLSRGAAATLIAGVTIVHTGQGSNSCMERGSSMEAIQKISSAGCSQGKTYMRCRSHGQVCRRIRKHNCGFRSTPMPCAILGGITSSSDASVSWRRSPTKWCQRPSR